MGNQESCYEDPNQQGQIQSNFNSVRYGSAIYNAQHPHSKPHSKTNQQVFTQSKLQIQTVSPRYNNFQSSKSSKLSSHYELVEHQKERLVQKQAPNEYRQENNPVQDQRASRKHYVQSQVWLFEKTSQNNDLCNSQYDKHKYSNQQVLSLLKRSNFSQQSYHKVLDSIEDQKVQINLWENQAYRNSIQTEPPLNLTAKLKTEIPGQSQLVIEYLPKVKNVIDCQKPFESQLSLVPKSKIKICALNQGADIYKGQLNYYEKPHGYGVFVKQNKSVLIGKFDNGIINGMAFYIFSNGSFYHGNMLDSKANDSNGQYHSAAMSYLGGFKDNVFHGNAKQIAQHYYFQGVYQNNHRKEGVLKWNLKMPNNPEQQRYSNPNNLKTSKVRRQLIKLQYDFVYQGCFDAKQQFTGKGKLKDPFGQYIGDFVEGKKHGKAIYLYQNKLKYIGEYRQNSKQGYGKLYNCDETLAYQGYWKNNLPDGKGCSYDLSGKPHQMQFVQGISKILSPQ